MAQDIEDTTVEGEGFNFDQWVNDNELQEIEQLLRSHNATTTAQLTLVSSEIQSLMTDPQLLAKSYMIPKIMSALHNISTSVITIVVSEKEQAVVNKIETNLKTLDEIQKRINTLAIEFPQSEQKLEQQKLQKIKTTKIKINQTFANLFDALNKRKEYLLNQLNDTTSKDNNNDYKHNDDEKKSDIITSCKKSVTNLRKFLKQKKTNYNKLIRTKKHKSERETNILNMGQNVENEFIKTHTEIQTNMETLNKQISKNNNTNMDINFIVGAKYDEILNVIRNLGQIVSADSATSQQHIIFEHDWKWVPNASPPDGNGSHSYGYDVTNNGKTLAKTRYNNRIYMTRMDPWMSKQNTPTGKFNLFLKVDAMGESGQTKYNGIGVITKSHWESKGHGQVCCTGNKSSYHWRFLSSDVFISKDKVDNMPKISSVNEIIEVDINFENNTIGFQLYRNGSKNNKVASTMGVFPAMENEQICIALAVNNTGWKFSIIE